MDWEAALHTTKHAFIDTVKILPVIFIVYVLIEFIESHESSKGKFKTLLGGRSAPFFGALIGLIPQCGFSVVATKLYQKQYILVGTLIAVYFATSDEAIPILFSLAIEDPAMWIKLALLILIKVGYAMIVGFLLNLIFKKATLPADDVKEIFIEEDGCCHHEITEKRETFLHFVGHPFLHSLKISLYIFVINLLFGFVFEGLIGEARLAEFLSGATYLQPLLSTAIGLVPNCASSVLLAQLYAKGVLSLGGAISGLAINSGLGLAVLLKDKENLLKSLKILFIMVVLSLAAGYLVTFLEGLFL